MKFLLIFLLLLFLYSFSFKEMFDNEKIPQQIHQIWIGNQPLHEHKKMYMHSFKHLLPDFEYKLWTNEDVNIKNFPLTFPYLQIILNLDHKGKYAMASDLMRYEILYHHGGFYFDTNIELLQPIETILPNFEKYTFILCHEHKNLENLESISNGFFACTKNNIYLKKILSRQSLDAIDFNNPANMATGPFYFGKAFDKKNELQNKNIKFLDSHIIYPVYTDTPDHCISLSPKENTIQSHFKDKTYYIEFPCKQYKNSLAIDHFIFGCSWC